ncbi:ATP-binding cassette domain-containing protein [Candidatus Bipolaricaulota bacterium]|nr:ATP-binding cassette domain-containing protein [Candidatus Bipolaricaulota bacterium]
MTEPSRTILAAKDVKKYYPVDHPLVGKSRVFLRAVDGVSFDVNQGDTFALVGESGCGKTTVARLILRLTDITAGSIHYRSKDIRNVSGVESKGLTRKVQVIFQDPYSALNPRKTIRSIIQDPLRVSGGLSPADRNARVREVTDAVGLDDNLLDRYPHEYSGGQRQRVVIARALILNPELVICDEPVSALDVSIRSQILNLLKELQRKYGITYLFISHDLSVVKYISDRIAVMYLGKICECAGTEEFYRKPIHPYSQALLSVIPIPDPRLSLGRERLILEGEIPSPISPPPGCSFHTRCPFAQGICKIEAPELKEIGADKASGRMCACHFTDRFA